MAQVSVDGSSSSFHEEIKCMMYSFGDARYPNPDSALLIEEITKQQMENIVVQAAKVIHIRGCSSMNPEDVLFLLRKDKGKLGRLLKHLRLKEAFKTADSDKSIGTSQDGKGSETEDSLLPQAKKTKFSVSFLGPLDAGYDYLGESDEEEETRLQKQDALTKTMDSAEYVDYTECRRVSFHRKAGKFREWLKLDSYIDFKPTHEVMEVLGYLAYDTVREIVEMSLQVKKDLENIYLDPSNHSLAPKFCVSSLTQRPITDTSCIGTRSIQPAHIREAMRRHASLAGPLVPLATHFSKSTTTQKTLCC